MNKQTYYKIVAILRWSLNTMGVILCLLLALSLLTSCSLAEPVDKTNTVVVSTNLTGLSHTGLTDIGSNSHATIDSHIANTTTAHNLNLKAPLTSPNFNTSITGSYLTASEILLTDASKNITSADVATYPSLTELTYVKGVTSTLQTQLGLKAPLASPTFTGTVILSATTLNGAVALNGQQINGQLNLDVAPLSRYHHHFGGDWSNSNDSTDILHNIQVDGTLTAINGTTYMIAGTRLQNYVVTQNHSETISIITQLYAFAPVIAKGSDTVNVAATIYVEGAPTAGVKNAAIYVTGGNVYLNLPTSNPGAGILWNNLGIVSVGTQ